MFSVIIPLYNKELSIQNTIKSVLAQSYQRFEIIVVNDGSNDSSVKKVAELNDARIKLIHQKNQGVSAARNRGIREASYEWIAFLDGDDLWEPNHLEEVLKMMQKFPDSKAYVTSFRYSDNRTVYKHTRTSPIFKIENYFKEVLKENLIWTGVITVNKICFKEVGMFNQQLSYGEDLELWARIARNFTVIKSSAVTAIYRVEAENRSNKSFNLKRSRVYYYDLSNVLDIDEYTYYRTTIISALRGFLVGKKLRNFFLLLYKHKSHINLLDILKGKA